MKRSENDRELKDKAENKYRNQCFELPKSARIFLIANSFGLDSVGYLWEILHASGIDNVTIGVAYIGGCSLDRHWSNIQSSSKEYEYHKNTDGEFHVTTDITLAEMLKDEDWDIITVQQAGNGHYGESAFGNLSAILNWICEHRTNRGARLFYNMVWPYSSKSEDVVFTDYFYGDCTAMFGAIKSLTQKFAVPNQMIDGIIPSGTAVQHLRNSHLTEEDIYRDQLHLSYSYGRYTVALLWYAYLFGGDITKIGWIPPGQENIVKDLSLIREAVYHALLYDFTLDNCAECRSTTCNK